MAGISDLPMLHDIDADYSPQYVKLARVLRDKIESGQYRRGDTLPAAELAGQYKVSVPVTCNALAMLGANIRALRQQHGWNQAKLGELMGWLNNSTVCAAEGRRNGRQRGFTKREVERLATLFGVSPSRLTTRRANCGGQPPTGFACLTCGARPQT